MEKEAQKKGAQQSYTADYTTWLNKNFGSATKAGDQEFQKNYQKKTGNSPFQQAPNYTQGYLDWLKKMGISEKFWGDKEMQTTFEQKTGGKALGDSDAKKEFTKDYIDWVTKMGMKQDSPLAQSEYEKKTGLSPFGKGEKPKEYTVQYISWIQKMGLIDKADDKYTQDQYTQQNGVDPYGEKVEQEKPKPPVEEEKPKPPVQQDWSFDAFKNSASVNDSMLPQQVFSAYEQRLNTAVGAGEISSNVRNQLLSAQPLSAKIGSMPTIKDNYKQWVASYGYQDTEQTRNQFSNMINDFTWMLEFGKHRTAQHAMEETAGVSANYDYTKYSKGKSDVPYWETTYKHEPLMASVGKAKSKAKAKSNVARPSVDFEREEEDKRFGF